MFPCEALPDRARRSEESLRANPEPRARAIVKRSAAACACSRRGIAAKLIALPMVVSSTAMRRLVR